MSDVDEKLDGEWLEALEAETPDDAGKPDDDKGSDNSDDDSKGDEDNSDDSSKGDEDSDDDDSKGADDSDGEDKPDENKPTDEPDEKFATKEAIKEALAEIETSKQVKTDTLQAFKKEVAETLYPEGIDRQLRDSDGDPITGIDDLTKLINPRTGELFTDEEAGSWLLSAQQKLNQDVQTVENFIEQVAEVNANVKSGAERVAEKYGDLLRADEKLRVRLIQAYDKTLVKDPKTGITINNPIDVEEFFDMALEGRVIDQAAAEEAAAKAAKAAKAKAAKDGQADRSDLKPNGKGDNIDPEDKEWALAYKSYEEGA